MLRRSTVLGLIISLLTACTMPHREVQVPDPQPITLTILETMNLMDREALDGVIRLYENGQTVYAQRGHRPVVGYEGALAVWRRAVGEENAHLTEEALSGVITDFWWSKYREVRDGLYQYLQGEAELEVLLPRLEAELNG